MKKAFRLFISSTFEDFKIERDLLQNEVFPKIREYCESKGFSFQPIDLRWGINNEAQLDQKTLPVCLREVRNCASYPHPNFLIMLGDRYGWVPLPYIIDKKEFDDIRKNLKSSDKQLLDEWYRLDKNQLSEDKDRGCYILKRRDGAFVKYEEWYKVEEKIRQILQKASENLSEEKKKKYFMSATHHEFEEICKNESNKNFIIPIFRRFKNQKQPRNQNIENFRQSVENNIPKECKHNIINEEIDDKFKIYSKSKFIAQIVKKLKANIDAGIKELSSAPENFEHNIFKTQQIDTFLGRQKSLKKIANYLDDETDTPLIIYSRSGMGKTTLMKKAIEEAEEATLGKARIFYKFVGADGKSFYKRDLLTDLICEIEGSSQKDNLNNLSEYDFDKYISELLSSDKDENVVIFIDALDQLKATDQLFWLPQKLGKNVKIILSVLKDEEFRDDSIYFKNLIKKYGDKNTINLNNDSLSSEAKGLFENFLGKHKRTLTKEQINEVENKFKNANCSPLYAFIVSQELKNISSNDKVDIADDIPSAINEFIDNLENLYHQEELLIQKVLSYIAFSKYGISENELLDLLSKEIKSDKKFYNKVFFIKNVSLSNNISFPISLWASLSSLLEPFLTLVYKDDKLLINFFHRQFIETISKRYEKYKQETHLKLAEYFCGFEKKEKLWDERYYSPRALSELFYHLYYSNSKKFEKYLNDLELIGSIYDHYKFKDFREILDNLDEDKFLAQKSFYREKDYLFNDNTNYFKPHIVLFQLAYADGEDSQLTISAKKLLRAGKVNFCWLKSSNIPANFTRTGLLAVFDWENAKRLSNGNFLVTKSGGNQCIFSKDFKFLSDLRTRYKSYYELQNGNLLNKTFKTIDYDDIEIITTITNDGQNVNAPKELIFEKELENGDLLLYDGKSYGVYSVDLNLKKQYSNEEFDFFMIQKYELDMQDNYKYYLGQDIKIERITYDYIYDEDDYPISLYNYNIYDKKDSLLITAQDVALFKNKYILLNICKDDNSALHIYSLGMKLIKVISLSIKSCCVKELSNGDILLDNGAILTSEWEIKYKFEKITLIKNNTLLVADKNGTSFFDENLKNILFVSDLEFKNLTKLKNQNLLIYFEHRIDFVTSDLKNITTIASKKDSDFFSTDDIHFKDFGDIMVLYRDRIDIKFYETKTGKLFKTLPAQDSIIGLETFDNKVLINFRELKKAFLYSLKQSYNKISNFNGKLEKVSAFTNNYVIAYFSNENIYIYYKDFKIKKLYEHCDDFEIQKDTFTIKEKNSDICIINKELKAIKHIKEPYTIGECLSNGNILLYELEDDILIKSFYIYLKSDNTIKKIDAPVFGALGDDTKINIDSTRNKVTIERFLQGEVVQKYIYDKNGNSIRNAIEQENKNPSYRVIKKTSKGMKLELRDNDFIMEVYFKYYSKMYINYTKVYRSNILLDKNNNFILTLNFVDSENEGHFKEITTIYNHNRERLKTIMDASPKKQLSNGNILMASGDLYSTNYKHIKRLYGNFIKELDDGSLIFTENDKTFYYDADYRLVNSSSIFNIDATKHDKFDYIPDKRIFIYHYDPNRPRVIEFNYGCKVKNFKDYYVVVFKHGIAILYKYIDKRKFFYIPEETTVIKIYKNKCLVYNEDGFSYFMFS
ncbi:ATP-binding protein [Campylobacter concisus]|uniref:Putative Gnn protein n=1 Tax=Campylobacter concisus UNSW2 TaxID=1242965 RepID=U2GVC8_9BACT|nr:ATP-binding protein [Campylobacter concisus]ERJ32019.1 Putative Gnn protein [Campylobacter concisus UNSW2]